MDFASRFLKFDVGNFTYDLYSGGGVDRNGAKDAEGKQINWRIGELEWEAWMRVLDNAVSILLYVCGQI